MALNLRSKPVVAAVVWMILALLALSTLYPLVFLVFTAIRPDADYLRSQIGLPTHVTFSNVSTALGDFGLLGYTVNSAVIVSVAVVVITVIACLAAFALTQFEFPLRKTTLVIVVGMIALPPSVLVIPIFRVVTELGLLNTRQGLVLVYASLNLPFSIYLVSSYMRSIPRELISAALVDGASTLRTLWHVVLPLIRPGLLTLITLNFLFLWNDLLFSLVVLQSSQDHTIMVGLALLQGQYIRSTGVLAAGLLLSALPPLLIFLFFQKRLASGLTAGAVK